MSYVKENLMPDEKILFTARVSPAIFIPSIFVFILTIMLLIISLNNATESTLYCIVSFIFIYTIFLGIKALIIILTTEFAVTNHRVIAKTGFIRRHTLELLLSKIESVSVNQNILGRLLNFGTVTVTGTGGTKESFTAIVDPINVRRKITQIIEGYMQGR